ncbi:MAG: DUF3024 domain-containing protein [Gammaproteobacteria bacterium]|nr:DUF3024 domain-containing protein [Gammaproteobacteria bacterium]
MAISEFEEKRCEKLMREYIEKKRPPMHMRKEIDLSFRLKDQSVEIFEIHQLWNDSSKLTEHPVAKATYIKSKKIWKLYWQRADLKWHSYDPVPEVNTLEEFINVIERPCK